jgi:glutathione S-transferase
MSFEYLTVADAITRPGLRMVVVGKVPSPWGEAAKAIFHIKNIDWSAVRLAYDDPSLASWAGQLTGPVAIFNDEDPRAGWEEILTLAERLQPDPPLLPADAGIREQVLLLAEKFCGQGGFGWHRRLQMVRAGLSKNGGFNERVAGYLGQKYGYDPARVAENDARVRTLLGEFAALLRAQQASGKPYYLGDTLTAADIYSATFMAFVRPLPDHQCAMHPGARAAFELLDDETRAAVDPILIAHRDMMYARHLELPLSL